jgi:hypothetical protein
MSMANAFCMRCRVQECLTNGQINRSFYSISILANCSLRRYDANWPSAFLKIVVDTNSIIG